MDLFIFLATTSILILALLISRLTHHSEEQHLSRETIEQALYRLGEQANDAGESLTLIIVGGTALMLGYNARNSTRDVDAFMMTPPERSQTRQWALMVAQELGLPADWLNDGAKGFMQGVSQGPLLLSGRGIMVYQVSPEQLLAMKLGAWRGGQDRDDARVVLMSLQPLYADKEAVWDAIRPFLTVFESLKASYAFEELWTDVYGD
jgi:hypothetical protein